MSLTLHSAPMSAATPALFHPQARVHTRKCRAKPHSHPHPQVSFPAPTHLQRHREVVRKLGREEELCLLLDRRA